MASVVHSFPDESSSKQICQINVASLDDFLEREEVIVIHQKRWENLVLQYLFVKVDGSSQFYPYRNFIHLLFPDQVKIFFGQYN